MGGWGTGIHISDALRRVLCSLYSFFVFYYANCKLMFHNVSMFRKNLENRNITFFCRCNLLELLNPSLEHLKKLGFDMGHASMEYCIIRCNMPQYIEVLMYFIFNSLWPSDAMWRFRTWSILVQAMARCRQAASHYLRPCWLTIGAALCNFAISKTTIGN